MNASVNAPAAPFAAPTVESSKATTNVRDFFNTILPSPRLLVYTALGAVLWFVGALLPGFVLIAGAYDVGLILLCLVDVILSPRPSDFELRREFEPKMNLGTRNDVAIYARQRSRLPVSLVVRDEVPSTFAIETKEPPRIIEGQTLPPIPRFTLRLEPNREEVAHYGLTPNRRGDFRFGPLHARYSTGLGLFFRQFSREASLGARVYPDVSAVRRYEMALRDGKMRDIGLHLLRLRGRGTEFESLRDYTSDDEYKSINWKASARRGKIISTNYEIERDQTILICLDCGRLMTSMALLKQHDGQKISENSEAAQSQNADYLPLSKLDCAINATVLLAHVAASMGDSVGLLLFSDVILNFLPPRKGRVQTGLIIEALYNAQPALVEADYQLAAEHILSRKMRRALIVNFTDLIDPEASRELLQASATLRRHHNPLCVTINNHDVIEMAEASPRGVGELYEKAMAQRMLQQRTAALEALRGAGVGILDVEVNQLTIATVNRYLDLKSRGAM